MAFEGTEELRYHQEYRDHVRAAFEAFRLGIKVPSAPLFNRSGTHAAIILEYVFRSAEREICILSGCLNPIAYADDAVVTELRAFLREREGNLEILLDDITRDQVQGLREHRLFRELRELAEPRRIWVGLVPGLVRDKFGYNFAVADSKSFRFERDRGQPRAHGQFGAGDVGEMLRARFREILAQSEDITADVL